METEALRQKCVDLLCKAQDGHPGSVMSIVEIVAALDPSDNLIISEGHAGMVVYPLLLERGLITQDDYDHFRERGTLLTMFPHKGIPGILVSCGSLGQGLGYACGFAWANRDKRYVCIISEGELYEGSTWESLMFARHYNLTNLRVIVNKNDAITLGRPQDCLDIPWEMLDAFSFVEVVQTVKGKGVPAWEGKVSSHYFSDPYAAAR